MNEYDVCLKSTPNGRDTLYTTITAASYPAAVIEFRRQFPTHRLVWLRLKTAPDRRLPSEPD